MSEANHYTLVTGASSGIGKAIAICLSKERKIILGGRDVSRLEETRRECIDSTRHVIWPYDLKYVDDLAESLKNLLEERQGAVVDFIHCAGMVTVLPMRTLSHKYFQEIMTVNFFSAAEIITVLLKKKINNHQLRSVVFISSIWSKFGARGHSAYCASKGALDAMMKALSVELAPEIRVNSILPGAIQTSMAEGFNDPQICSNLERDYPLGVGSADDIAHMVEFLVSDKAKWITGQQIIIDGGRTANMSLK